MFRGLCITFAQLAFYLSLGIMAFATATTITYANALFVTALAVPILGERVGLWRWAAVMVGFAGVIMVVGPGRDAFSLAAFLPLAAAFLYAMAAVTAQRLDADVPTPLANLYSTGIALVGSVIMALAWGGFTPVASGTDLFWLVTMGTVGGSAVLLLVSAYRMTEQSNLAPFSYFGIPLAFVMGWIVFDENPWRDLFPGSILIIAGGLMIIWRERRLTKR
jgi:drug/metabolite transporter (DMT)-like permease